MRKPEVLAPAGSMEALKASVNAGADAVYLGGTRFGARAYAGNFEENELLEGIRFAHLYGVKVYLTVNTLFRNEEIEELYDYMLPYYSEGLDAVIVQDFGVMRYIHEFFPELPIHASTQMTITTPYAYSVLKDYGVTRIVPARELSITELKRLKSESLSGEGMIPELEVFVQGALCFCYSGQCLMSSFIGGRSGNRGRCAGSCRLPYMVMDAEANPVNTKGNYPLSPKDLCGLDSLSELISSGVDSLKIEGRMKGPEYVAACVRSYRKCVDYLCDNDLPIGNDSDIYTVRSFEKINGSESIILNEKKKIDFRDDSIAVDEEYKELVNRCKEEMAEVFNRDGFTSGYYHKKNGKDMMSTVYPGHMGVVIGSIAAIKNNKVSIKLSKNINKGDVLVIRNRLDEEVVLTSNVEGNASKIITLNAPKAKSLKVGMTVFRRLNYRLQQELREYIDGTRKIIVDGSCILRTGKRAELRLSAMINDRSYEIASFGSICEAAESKPVSAETVEEKLRQTGNSTFEFGNLSIDMEDGVFISIREIKELRRNSFLKLEMEICGFSKREINDFRRDNNVLIDNKEVEDADIDISVHDEVEDKVIDISVSNKETCEAYHNDHTRLRILVSDKEQLEAVSSYVSGRADASVAIDLQYFTKQDIMGLIKEQPQYGFALPMIMREQEYAELEELCIVSCKELIVRNIDELSYLKSIGYDGRVIADYSLYAMNDFSAQFIRSQFGDALITLPVELNEKQLKKLSYNNYNSEWVVYGYQPLMVSAQCFAENGTGCVKGYNPSFILKDRRNQTFRTRAVCKYCSNILYNCVPTVIFNNGKLMNDFKGTLRFHFTTESNGQVKDVLEAYYNGRDYVGECTGGHFKRGIE
ncbi:MAG: U32 family peptidase [Lachnospiraceae bacterium]|nr:U32 family peptidase [Lachnospiraceae bacterium]